MVQEALSNIRKHANATQASIALEGMGDWYTLSVEDNGKGFDPREAMERGLGTGHFGLITMRERAELIGGSLTIKSAPGAGPACNSGCCGWPDLPANAPRRPLRRGFRQHR